MRNILTSLIVGAVVVGLSGCGDKAATNTEPKPSLADATSPKAVEAIKKEIVQSALPKGEKSTPVESYVEYNSGHQLMFSYLALSKLPIDYKEIATSYSRDYATTQDEFKKNDLLTALKPRIDGEVAKATAQRYIKITIGNPIQKYDFEKKGFPLDGSVWESGSYRYFNDNNAYKLGFTNGDAFRYLKVADESDARNIETLRSKYESMNLVIYVFAQDADITNKSVKAEIVKVVLVDKKGTTLASQ